MSEASKRVVGRGSGKEKKKKQLPKPKHRVGKKDSVGKTDAQQLPASRSKAPAAAAAAASGEPDVAPPSASSSSSVPGVAAATATTSPSSSSMSMVPNLASSLSLSGKKGKGGDCAPGQGQGQKETSGDANRGAAAKGGDSEEPDTEPLLPTGPSSDVSGEEDESECEHESDDAGGTDGAARAQTRAQTRARARARATAVEKDDSQDADDENVDGVQRLVSSFERLSFDRLVQGWEAIIGNAKDPRTAHLRPYPMTERSASNESQSSTRRPDLLLQPIHFKHTHSSPIRPSYTKFYDEEDDCCEGGAAPMKRSSSTPSPFRHNSLASAFSQPLQRRSYAAMSDPGVYFSAFDPVRSTAYQGTMEQVKASLVAEEEESEEDDSKPAAAVPSEEGVADPPSSEPRKSSFSKSRASRFLPDMKSIRKRRLRSGRENPARPPSSSSSSKDGDNAKKETGHDVVAAGSTSSIRPKSSLVEQGSISSLDGKSATVMEATTTLQMEEASPEPVFPSLIDQTFSDDKENDDEDDDIAMEVRETSPAVRHYDSLGSEDVEDETEGRPGSIETALTSSSSPALPASASSIRTGLGSPGHAESPTPIPSPAYQQFVDEIPEDSEVGGVGDLQLERITKTPPAHPSPAPAPWSRLAVSPQPRFILQGDSPQQSNSSPSSNLSPSSHGSGSNSRTTSQSQNTSSQGQSTSMSETMSSGQTVTSSVAEADREVMEANRREKIRREAVVVDIDGTASVHSASTASTNPTAYIALTSSPVQIREGARIPVDRFFGAALPMSHSSSSNTGGSGDSVHSGPLGVASIARKTFTSSGLMCGVVAGVGTSSPTTLSSSSVANTNSSSSTGEEPPRLVAYLDRQSKSKMKTTAPTRPAPRAIVPVTESPVTAKAEESEERGSPAPIIGYTKLESEEPAGGLLQPSSQHPKVVRPAKKGEKVKKLFTRAKPPRSPAKMDGRARTPTPTLGQSSSGSMGGTPPRRIIDPRGPHDLKNRTGVTRPKIFRSGFGSGSSGRMVLLSPSSSGSGGSGRDTPAPEIKTIVGAQADDGAQEVFTAGSPSASVPAAINAVSPDDHRSGSPAVEFDDDDLSDLPFDERKSYIEELKKQKEMNAHVGEAGREKDQGSKSTDSKEMAAVITPEKASKSSG